MKIKLGNRVITNNSRPYIIAEIGVNHENSLEKAKILVDQAKLGGADAVKFQSYTAEKLASKNSPAYWDTTKEKNSKSIPAFKKYDQFSYKEYEELSNYCKQINIDFSSTPFDEEAVDYLEELVPFYKVASSDITYIPLLKKIGSKNKPVLISTGCSNYDEIDLAIKTLRDNGVSEIAILHCILNYPTIDKSKFSDDKTSENKV